MIFTSISRFLLIIIFAFSAVVNAKQSDSPYQGIVFVGGQSEAQLKESALKQVLVKVSGNKGITQNNETKQLLKKTQQMISQYGYQKIEGNDYFSAVFDRKKINQALKEMQQPVWGDTRPTTLIWLINNNKLVSDNDIKAQNDASITNAIKKAELNRGIRVQFPLMDLEDNLALSISDVKGRFYEQVGTASARYGRNHFIAAELQSMGNERWKLNLQLLQKEAGSRPTSTLLNEEFVDNKSKVITKMINALADYYAEQYAVLDNNGEKFEQLLHINGVNSLTQLSQLNDLLNSLLVISSYNIVGADKQQLSVEVKINGSVNSFKNTLIAQSHLQFDSVASTPSSSTPSENIENSEETSLPDNNDSAQNNALYFNWR